METSRFEIASSASSYQILARLAKGGMAELFLARSTGAAGITRFVVMKRVLRERANDFHFVQMFLDEARLAAQLQHPNIAQVYDVGRLGDSYFFTMEYVHGETVRAIMERAGQLDRPPPLTCVLATVLGAAAGLHHAHERIGVDGTPLGIVHRDVSPSNLMVGYEGHIKLVDFGVAKATSRESETASGTIKGKIAYLSPEQAIGSAIDRRSDVFSLGIVLWEMLTGTRLFKRESDFLTMRAIVDDAAPPPSSRRSEVPAALDAVVLTSLAKDPSARFASAHEMFEALERVGVTASTATVSRYLHELFGARPEPWRVLQRERSSVTLTAQPITDDLGVPVTSPIDAQLATIAELRSVDVLEERRTTPYVLVDASGMVRPLAIPRRRRTELWIGAAAVISLIIAIAIAFSKSVTVPVQSASVAPDPDAMLVEPAPVEAPLDASEPAVDAPAEPEPPPPVRARTDREVFAACRSASPECVIAACRLRKLERARGWFAQVPAAQRGRVAQRCRAAGVTLAPRTRGPDCDADPSGCQF